MIVAQNHGFCNERDFGCSVVIPFYLCYDKVRGGIMNQKSKYMPEQALLEQYTSQQEMARYKKSADANYTLINYVPEGSVRIWVNNDCIHYNRHVHQSLEIIYPLVDNYIAHVGSEKYEIQPGEIFFIPSGLPHELEPSGAGGTRLVFVIDMDVLSKLHGFSYMMAFLSSPTLINEDIYGPLYDELAQLLLKMCHEYFSPNVFREVNIYSDLLVFLSKYSSYCLSLDEYRLPPELGNGRQKHLNERLSVVFDYVDAHFTENITLEKTAAIAGFSKFHFSRLFKQCTGHNFYDYLCYRRIKNAETMLHIPGITITEVALQSGFSSLSTFNRTFRKLKDCTPSEYRNIYMKGDYFAKDSSDE